jgi:hypothetical protein
MRSHQPPLHLRGAVLPGEAVRDVCWPALGAASWHARRDLGRPGIEEGAPADVVGYRDDPRADVEELRRPAMILLNGQRIR